MTGAESPERFLITGGHGCIGAWVAKLLVAEGVDVTIADISEDAHRLELITSAEEREHVGFRRTDLTSGDEVDAAIEGATHVVHLGALQVPFCRADPRAGAAVNVGGTINVFEAALRHGVQHLVFASSIAVYGVGADPAALVTDTTPFDPGTLYGAYKVANEHSARVYAAEHGMSSICLRPHTLYGPGRDQGLTSQPTQAIAEAIAGRPFEIEYSATMGFQFVPDVARWFIAAARAEPDGTATSYNLGGSIASVARFVEAIERAVPDAAELITFADGSLPFPPGCDDTTLRARLGDLVETSLDDGVAQTAAILGA